MLSTQALSPSPVTQAKSNRGPYVQAVTNILFAGLAAGGGTLFSGLVIMPTLASEEMKNEVEGLVRGIGQSLSGYASHMFVPDRPVAQEPSKPTSRRSLIQQRMQEEIVDDEEYRYAGTSLVLPSDSYHMMSWNAGHCSCPCILILPSAALKNVACISRDFQTLSR